MEKPLVNSNFHFKAFNDAATNNLRLKKPIITITILINLAKNEAKFIVIIIGSIIKLNLNFVIAN